LNAASPARAQASAVADTAKRFFLRAHSAPEWYVGIHAIPVGYVQNPGSLRLSDRKGLTALLGAHTRQGDVHTFSHACFGFTGRVAGYGWRGSGLPTVVNLRSSIYLTKAAILCTLQRTRLVERSEGGIGQTQPGR
jgi:hypothetical protein